MTTFLQRHRGRLLALLTVVGVTLMIWLDARRPPAPGPLEAGEALPNETLAILGRAAPLHLADLKGKPAVLDFWATWCEPCRESLPHLNTLAKKYDSRVNIYAVDGDSQDTVAAIAQAKSDLGLTIPIATNGGGLAEMIGLEGFPTTVILDKQGKVATSFVGMTSEEVIEGALDKLL